MLGGASGRAKVCVYRVCTRVHGGVCQGEAARPMLLAHFAVGHAILHDGDELAHAHVGEARVRELEPLEVVQAEPGRGGLVRVRGGGWG